VAACLARRVLDDHRSVDPDRRHVGGAAAARTGGRAQPPVGRGTPRPRRTRDEDPRDGAGRPPSNGPARRIDPPVEPTRPGAPPEPYAAADHDRGDRGRSDPISGHCRGRGERTACHGASGSTAGSSRVRPSMTTSSTAPASRPWSWTAGRRTPSGTATCGATTGQLPGATRRSGTATRTCVTLRVRRRSRSATCCRLAVGRGGRGGAGGCTASSREAGTLRGCECRVRTRQNDLIMDGRG